MKRRGAGRWRHYLHDRLSKILGAPITQAGLEGGTDVVPVTTGLVAILARLDRHVKNEGIKQLDKTKQNKKTVTRPRPLQPAGPLPAQVPCQTSCECGGTGGSEALVPPTWGCREVAWPAALWLGVWAPRWSDWSCWCWAWVESRWRNRGNNTGDRKQAEHVSLKVANEIANGGPQEPYRRTAGSKN